MPASGVASRCGPRRLASARSPVGSGSRATRCRRGTTAQFGPHLVSGDDIVFGDDDGVLFVAAERVEEVLAVAHQIWQTEREQARKIQAGETLRRQTAFDDYLTRRATDPSYTFRQHLRQIRGAIEE